MKVIIDISRLNEKALKRGVGFYTLNLYKMLKTLKNGDEYYLNKNQKERFKADLIHYPYFDPFFLTLKIEKDIPVIATVHDLIPLKFSRNYPAGIKGKIKLLIQKNSLKKTKAIITDSLSSKKDIHRILGYPLNNIYSVYLAADPEYQKLEDETIKDSRIKEKYKLPDNFLLYVGDLNWNKNIEGLLKAFSNIKYRISNIKLVFIGSAFENKQLEQLRHLDRLICELKLQENIIKLGFIQTNELVAVYNLASLYIQPSFYEGFGLPVLEAMSCGCPVLSSDQGSLPEVGGSAVMYFNPYKCDDLYAKISNLLNNKNKLMEYSQLGIKQAQKFSWKKTALETRKVYEKILTGN